MVRWIWPRSAKSGHQCLRCWPACKCLLKTKIWLCFLPVFTYYMAISIVRRKIIAWSIYGYYIVYYVFFNISWQADTILISLFFDICRKYKLPVSRIIPFPKRNDPSSIPDFPQGRNVLAVYPGTTALYKATVVNQRKVRSSLYFPCWFSSPVHFYHLKWHESSLIHYPQKYDSSISLKGWNMTTTQLGNGQT